jgi:oxygen-independent coproporphyrinogen-3 oxidase
LRKKTVTEKRELSIYVHIPFCKAKCSYCDFLSFGGCGHSQQLQYVKALCREIQAYEQVAEPYWVETIFFGGGTPSYIEGDLIDTVLDTIRQVFQVAEDAEITIEGNPDSLTLEKMTLYRNVGINRLSIGLQSTNDEMLQRIGRVHNYQQFDTAFTSARQVGFDNINVDIMYALPGETMESYLKTLEAVVQREPEHISSYSLIVEEGTPLAENEVLLGMIPEEEEDREMYARTKHFLQQSGYQRYEISNYAREGFECRHNKVYWTGGEYLGFGLGAASYMKVTMEDGHLEPVRFHGVESLDEYVARFSNCQGMREDEYTGMFHGFEEGEFYDVEDMFDMSFSAASDGGDYFGVSTYESENNLHKYREYENNAMLEFLRDYYKDLYFCKRKDEMEEFMFLGLRMMQGISKNEFKNRFGVTVESVYGRVIEKYKQRQLLIEEGDRLYLSDAGIDVSNVVMAEFML